jgi:hypothetical protein
LHDGVVKVGADCQSAVRGFVSPFPPTIENVLDHHKPPAGMADLARGRLRGILNPGEQLGLEPGAPVREG